MDNIAALSATELPPRIQRVCAVWRRLPAFRGKLRLGRRLLGRDLNARNVMVADRQGNRFVLPDLREPMAEHLLLNGVYEAEVLDLLEAQLPSNAVFVDVGANIGLFTIAIAQHLRGRGHVLAIEASPHILKYLRANIALNQLQNVSVYDVAASDHVAAAVPFYEAPLERFGMGSLAPQFHDQPIWVPTQSLDALIDQDSITRVHALKIDVEGFEAAALRGATRLLTQTHPPWVVFEFAAWAEGRAGAEGVGAAQRLLHALHYDLWRLEDWQRGAKPLEAVLTEGSAMLVAQRRVNG